MGSIAAGRLWHMYKDVPGTRPPSPAAPGWRFTPGDVIRRNPEPTWTDLHQQQIEAANFQLSLSICSS